MHQILVAGSGVIGRTVAQWLAASGDYMVYLVDVNEPLIFSTQFIQTEQMDVSDHGLLERFIEKHQVTAIVSTLPYYFNIDLAVFSEKNGIHYFDPTEDVEVTEEIKRLSYNSQTVFVPQCGLAPGFVDILASHYIQDFDTVRQVKLRCGALPQYSASTLHYAFTWSPDGVINEYINQCEVLQNGERTQVRALGGVETIEIDGGEYEAFHTSGGLGTLAQTYQDQVEAMDYKSIRYPGHAEKMNFLINDLKLCEDRENLRHILTNVIPFTDQDVVLVYVSVKGMIDSRLQKKSFAQKYYPKTIFGVECSAIQLTTTAGLCAIVDMVLNDQDRYSGFIKQEQFDLDYFFSNRFGKFLSPNENSGRRV